LQNPLQHWIGLKQMRFLHPGGVAQTPPLHCWMPPQEVPSAFPWHGGGGTTTQRPPSHFPPGHTAPSGFFFLHLPCLRLLQDGHFFLAGASSGSARPSRISTTPRAVATARRREPAVDTMRGSVSKRNASIRRLPGVIRDGGVMHSLGTVEPNLQTEVVARKRGRESIQSLAK
jgi:hypothetical protein